jgi:indole-3-glycerol phosphate synthase
MQILETILTQKRIEIQNLDPVEWKQRAAEAAPTRGFLSFDANRMARASHRPALIAEIKKASPSRGTLNASLDPIAQARIYADNGAAAISVLTDEQFFHGSADILTAIHAQPALPPLLRKDFIVEDVQIYQSRALGADALLLIVAALNDARLADLHALANALGMTALVEAHTSAELDRALRVPGVRWIGINNRDLTTFIVRRETALQLIPRIPASIGAVVESGIFTREDVAEAEKVGADAVLVGEALVTAADIPAKVRELAGRDTPPLPSPFRGG